MCNSIAQWWHEVQEFKFILGCTENSRLFSIVLSNKIPPKLNLNVLSNILYNVQSKNFQRLMGKYAIERKSKVTAITKNRDNFKRYRRFED